MNNSAAEPGEPMRMMAALLADRGVDICLPEREESRTLRVSNAGPGQCEIDVEDNTSVVWEYDLRDRAEPTGISGMVLGMLGADGARLQFDARAHVASTLKGMVGRDLRARGLKPVLEVYEDHDAVVEVVVTNPARPERGLVRIADDGMLRWECDYEDLPEGAAAVADTTVAVLASAGQAGDGSGG